MKMPVHMVTTTHLDNSSSPVGERKGANLYRENEVGLDDVCDQLRLLNVSTSHGAYFDRKSQTMHVFGDAMETMQILGFQNMDGDTFLHHVIIMEQYDLAIKLIEFLFDSDLLNMANFLRQTPLHLAVITRQTAIVRKLLAAGAQTNVHNHRGDTPMHIACRTGASDTLYLLTESLSSQNDLEIRNYDGLKCIHLAVLNNNLDIIRFLLNSGADINAGDAKSGRTVFHWAAEYGKSELLDLILSRKDVDINMQTYDGITAFEMARANGHLEIMKMFCESSKCL
ncbi:hypothetical protein CHS0354_015925 [Potamilus streckersoni]|uniref:Uncharacterized protein n=1 Tax=Potamilus streckersoni TaxID=2493646 RepID=A0AAE0SRV6_9BIVA|nr:hypothetical protein CHS0354_015925 [Potamilus streckersoni]